jgi:hypothetical protein
LDSVSVGLHVACLLGRQRPTALLYCTPVPQLTVFCCRILLAFNKIPAYITICLRVVLYGRGIWSRTLIPRVFENGVLKRMFGPKREKVAGGWRKCIMRNVIICNLHQVIKSKNVRWVGHIVCMADEKCMSPQNFIRKAWREEITW